VVKPGLNDESGFSQISLLSLSLTVCGGQTAPHNIKDSKIFYYIRALQRRLSWMSKYRFIIIIKGFSFLNELLKYNLQNGTSKSSRKCSLQNLSLY
jgi:hypothetical protein